MTPAQEEAHAHKAKFGTEKGGSDTEIEVGRQEGNLDARSQSIPTLGRTHKA